jgi:putative transposase
MLTHTPNCSLLLLPEGWEINYKRIRRIYRELGLQWRNKTPKRKVKAKLHRDRVQAKAPHECWSMDFLSDHLGAFINRRP